MTKLTQTHILTELPFTQVKKMEPMMDSDKRTWSSPQLYQIRFLVTEKCRNGAEASLTITTTLHTFEIEVKNK